MYYIDRIVLDIQGLFPGRSCTVQRVARLYIDQAEVQLNCASLLLLLSERVCSVCFECDIGFTHKSARTGSCSKRTITWQLLVCLYICYQLIAWGAL